LKITHHGLGTVVDFSGVIKGFIGSIAMIGLY